MITGLYAAANGMLAMEDRQAVIANNIANAATAGFRRQIPVVKGFDEILLEEARHPFRFNVERAPGGGVKTVETFSDTRSGGVYTTGNPLNVGLLGPGYLVVDTPKGERFTRNGELTVDVDGQLATADGYKVQGDGGPIDVRGGAVTIDESGMVRVDGVPAGQLRIVEFADPHMLTREGHTLYTASAEALNKSAPATNTRVVSAALERSNVEMPVEMAQMILGLRAYAANQRVINTFDETMSQVIDRVGAPL